MESHGDVEPLRLKAISYLQDLLLQHPGKPPNETAISIADLAYGEDNPVKDLFAAATVVGKGPPPSPKGTLKSRSSRSLLRLARLSKGASSDGKASTLVQQDVAPSTHGGTSSTSKSPMVPMTTAYAQSSKSTKACSSVQYRCIICNEILSSKGVCKRHLEDQHVSPKVYKCEKCAMTFDVKSNVKEHIKACGKGVFLYVVVKQEEKRTYACEFTGHIFSSMARYLEHLLHLSERSEGRPTGDLHRKLYALLGRPDLQPHVDEISSRVYGSRYAWRRLQWQLSDLSKAIERLEHATVHGDGTLEFGKHAADQQRVQDAQTHMYSLLCAGSMRPSSRRTVPPGSDGRSEAISRSSSTSFGSNGTVTPKATAAEPVSMPPPLPSLPDRDHHTGVSNTTAATIPAGVPPTDSNISIPYPLPDAVKSKRHLSDHSRFFVPVRHPPGPPLPSSLPQIYDLHVHDSGHSTPVNTSTASLPFRQQDVSVTTQSSIAIGPHTQHNYTPSLGNSVSSDAASESTLMSNFQEPELVTPMSFDYNIWHGQPNGMPYSLPYNNGAIYHMAPGYHYPADGSSTRTPSMATDQTFVVDYNGADQKSLNFDQASMNNMTTFGTFLLPPDDEESGDGQTMQ